MMKTSLTILLLSLMISGALACDSPAPVSMPTGPTVQPVTTPAPSPGQNTTVQRISIGEVVTATLRSADPYCVFDADDLTAPCARFSVAVAQAGTIVIRVTWGNVAHFVQIVFPRGDYRGGIHCCSSPHVERLAVEPGSTYEFQVWFIGATYGPGGHTPPAAEQQFALTTTFEPN